jgi:ATP-dependent Clp protease, protease subunit
VHNALERDRFLSPEEAKVFGIIDQIFEKRAVPEGATA